MVWPFKTAAPRAVEMSHVYLLDGGQVRAIQTDDDILAMLGVGTGADGLPLGERTRAMAYSASAACLRIISTLCAAAPVHAYRIDADGGRQRERDHVAERLLNSFASPWESSTDFVREMTLEAMFEGDAFARVIRVRKEARELQRLRNVSVEYDEYTQEPKYKVTRKDGGQEVLRYQDVIHLRSPTGSAPVKAAKNAILLGLLLEKSGIALFKHGGRPSGLLIFKAKVDPVTAAKVRAEYEEDIAANPDRVAVLGGDVRYEPLDFKSTDNEFLENRKMQVVEISRHFGPSPTLLGQLDDATLANVEHLGRHLLTYVIDPWLNQWASAITRCLIEPADRATVYVEHETASLTSADLKSTAEAIEKFVGGPVLTANDGRALLNRSKIEGGDVLYPPRGAAKPEAPEAA